MTKQSAEHDLEIHENGRYSRKGTNLQSSSLTEDSVTIVTDCLLAHARTTAQPVSGSKNADRDSKRKKQRPRHPVQHGERPLIQSHAHSAENALKDYQYERDNADPPQPTALFVSPQ